MSKKLYVGNLGPDANDESLKMLFEMFGTVERAYLITEKKTGESKGFGFVIMSSDDEAKAAIAALHGKKCGEFTVIVDEAKGK
ncbi:MAG: RNA recognition motif domain-containing protein [Planctomycetota bacterium]|jgi:RNA recognition motif-containing protein